MEVKFKDILNHPESVNSSQVEYLEKLIVDQPYFQAAHLLLAQKLYQLGKNSEFNIHLKKAAIYATDRKKLYHLIHGAVKKTSSTINTEEVINITNTSESNILKAQEILNQRLGEIASKKEVLQEKSETVSTEEKVLEIRTDLDPEENKNIKEINRPKPGYFSIEDLLELPEESKETEPSKTEEPSEKTIPTSSKLSFKDWIHYYSGEKSYAASTEQEEEKPKSQDLIDKFIKEDPRISPAKNNFFSPVNMARKSVIEPDDLISETLANIYYSQGNLHRALQMYEKLSLKFPEKSSFFASQIEKIQNSLKSN